MRILTFLLACFTFLTTPPVWGDQEVVIGVLAVSAKSEIQLQWQPLARYLNESVHRVHFSIEALDIVEMNAAVTSRKVDFVLTNPGHYVLMRYRNSLASPLATLVNVEKDIELYSFGGVIVADAKRADLVGLESLRGKTLASPDRDSMGGYQMQALELMQADITDFKLLQTGMPNDKAIQAVLEGRADAALVRTGVLEAMVGEGKLDPRRLRVINQQDIPSFPYLASTHLYPEWPIAALPHVGDDLALRVASALYGLGHGSKTARAIGIHGFTIPADYTPVENLLRSLRTPPFEAMPEFTKADIWHKYRGFILVIILLSPIVIALAIRLSYRNLRLQASEQRFRKMADSAPVLIWMSGNDKLCHYFNKVWLDFTGRTLAQESGNGWAEGIHPEDYQRCLDIYFSHFERRIPFQMEYRLKRHDGVYRWIVDSGTPLFEVGGVFSGYIGSCIDIDDSRQAAQKLKDDEALMSFALEGAGDSIWDWNVPTGEVALTGVGAAMFGYTESEASHHIEDWFALIPEEDQVRWREMLHNFFHEKSEKFSIEYRVCNRDGRTLWIMTRGMVWEQGADGRVTRMIGVHTDITQRKQSEDALRISADEIEDLYNHAPCGYHSFDKDEIIQRINDTELEWLGYTRDEVEGKLKMTDLLTHSSAQLFHKNFVLLKKRDLLNDIELEFLRKNGTVLNGLINSTVIRDIGGKYLKCRSTVFDISERKKTEETLRSLFTALEHGPIAVIITDAYANIQYVSPRFSEITGYAHADVLGRNLRILQASQISKFTYLEMWSALSNGHTWHGELLNHHKQGRAYWEDVHITPVKTLEGIVTNYVVVSADITERKMAEEQMKHLANFDPLTDLPNRSLVDDRLSQALAVAKRDKTLIALMFLDLDKFKPINDTFGHDVGDLVLKEVARRMLDCVRASDTIGRIGGDEFVVLLPTLDSDQHAVLVAEKIRHALNQPFELAGQELHISSSIGVALYPEHGEEGKTLVKNADCAMYCAKEAGRDNVQLFRKVMLES